MKGKIKKDKVEIKNKKLKENYEEKNNNENKPKGLYNLGLSCYMNSLLQCLFYIKDLRQYFINQNFADGQPVCQAFAEVMNGLKNCKKEYFEPIKFKKIMGKVNGLFFGVNAADVKDLFINLIDKFITELKMNYNDEDEDIENDDDVDSSNKIGMFNEEVKAINKNIIVNELFIGYYETIYKCTEKSPLIFNSYAFQSDSFILFELEKIKQYFKKKKLSLELCFKYYSREQLGFEFYCSECKKVHEGNAYEKIYRPPKILVVVLDRGFGKTFKGYVEIDKYLDLKNKIDEEKYDYSCLYKLICVSTHSGTSSSSGHYTACCLADNNKYYYFSDTYVHEIDEKEITQNEPYLLFYQQLNKEEENNIDEKYKIHIIKNRAKDIFDKINGPSDPKNKNKVRFYININIPENTDININKEIKI